MADRHVVPAETGWQVEKPDAKRPSAKTPTQAEAITRAVEIVANDGGGDVVVHGADGAVRETRTIVAGTEDTATPAAATAAAATVKGASATADKAADVVADTTGKLAEQAEDAAKKTRRTTKATAGKSADAAGDVADELADAVNGRKKAGTAARRSADAVSTAAKTIGDDVSSAASDVSDDVSAAGTKARAQLDRTARQAGDAVVDGADRAAVVGEDAGDRLQDASHRAGRFIHSFTERVASPIDNAAHALNPVRIAGRTAGVVIAGALHVGAVVTTRGTERARRTARLVTGRR